MKKSLTSLGVAVLLACLLSSAEFTRKEPLAPVAKVPSTSGSAWGAQSSECSHFGSAACRCEKNNIITVEWSHLGVHGVSHFFPNASLKRSPHA